MRANPKLTTHRTLLLSLRPPLRVGARLLAVLLLAHVPDTLAADTIYMTRDKHGNAVYTDQHTDDATEVTVHEASTYSPPPQPKLRVRKKKSTPTFTPYATFAITSPRNEQAIRDNTGNLTVTATIAPSLKPGHRVEVRLDGKPYGTLAGNSMPLVNIDRGTHELQLQLLDKRQPRVLQSSTPTTFTILRFSKLHRRHGQ